ncbi:MAG: Re/Si-specific NAD(P)(+) transhydrogenase subunit alpha [Planctomycetes bacterium]|nr:Re/Si-specific NAD(P)(+) transhydrogenase subunit alpha [Planctomycetota bacterium]
MPTLFVPRESKAGETRVAATPETVKQLVKAGLKVEIESGAGVPASFVDAGFQAVGAALVGPDAWGTADIVAKVAPPSQAELARLKQGAVLISFMTPSANLPIVAALRERGVSTLAMELIPRITRAQAMDALSSQATVAGYKAVLLGASHLAKMCPLLMTAAGTVPPAKCVVFGAGVAGLQAIATAKRLGCSVEATDVRLAAREQVLSLGAKFIDVPGMGDMEDKGGYAKEQTPEFLEKQRQEVAKRVAEADLVITTAQIPGRPAPKLVSRAMVESMKAGAVLVDLAVESGGNCELAKLGEVVVHQGVKIVGIPNLPASVPYHASELYAKNVLNLVKLFVQKDGSLNLEFKDEVLAGCLLTHAGEVPHKATAEALLAGAK